MTGITAQRCGCSTDPGKRRQEPEAPSVTEEHLLLQLAARRPKQYANRQFTDNRWSAAAAYAQFSDFGTPL